MQIPVVNLRPALDETAPQRKAYLDELFARSHFILGPQLAAFELGFARATGARFTVGVGSGTAALELCLRHAGITHSRQNVLTTPLTAPFTGIAILAAGASPRFADIDPETLLLSPDGVEEQAGPNTAAILPVHLYGQPCALDRFWHIARARGAILIQDACQAHGASFRGKPFTRFSPYVAYSFYPTKNLGCLGDGGAVATDSARVNREIRPLRDGGRKGDMISHVAGINSRLDEMQCCYLRAFLPRLEIWNMRRTRLAAFYDELLAGFEPVRPIRRVPGSVNHLYVVRTRRRSQLREYLASHGVGTGIHYPVPLHLHPAFRDCGARRSSLPHAERACREILSFPLWPHLSESEVEFVVQTVRAFFDHRY